MTSVTDISDSMPNQMVEGSPKLKLNAESPNDSDNIMFENNVDINNKSSAHTSAGNGNRDYNHMQCIISVEANEAVGYADELSHSSGSSGKAISGCNFVEVSEDLIGPCDTSRRRDTLAVTCLNDVGERFESKEESRDLRIFEEGDSSNKGETSQLGLNCKEDNIDKLMPETFDSLEDSRVCQNLNERNSCKKGGRSQLGFDRKEEERDCEKFNKTDSGYKSEGLCERFDSKEDISNCQNSETDSSHKDDRFQLELDVKENNRDGKAFKETDSGYRNIGLCERHDSKEVCSDYQEFDETDSHDKSKRSQLGFDGKDDNRDHNERDSGYKKEGLFQQSDLNLQKVQDFANEQSESGSDKRHNSIYQQGNMAPDKGQDMSLVDILQKPCAPSFRNGLLTSSIQEAVREKKCVSSEQCDSPSDRGSIREDTVPSGSTHHDVSELPDIDCDLTRSATQGSKASNKHGGDNAHNVTAKISARKKMKIMKRIAMVKGDGTVEVDVVGSARYALGLFGTSVEAQQEEYETKGRDEGEKWTLPPLQIAMLIVGTRGDVQPFLAIGKHLQEYGHRVRLATHSNFEDFVLTTGLEFYPLGGDPKILAEYMVKNKGFLPSGPSEIAIQRKQIKAIINSLLPACTDSYGDSGRPFRAQAIIANPPAYGHVHVAEALQVPLHIFFTMPWTPTSEFPHPLSRVKQSAGYWLSYQVVDSLIWLGIRDIINDFRKKKLKLRPVTYLSGKQGSITDLPTAYIWSPHLVPKPKDWGPKVDVVGFCFLDLAANYKPPESLVKWLEAGEKPIYVGFGSLPVQEPERMTKIIVQALEETGQRGIINKGWGGLGNLAEPVDFVYLLDNCPHDWLFPHCAAVVHHGGAGTTAAGLKAACPTTVVPFFGDQPFWGERVHARGVGPMPIPVDQFSLDKLVPAINFMLDRKVKESALDLAKAIENEDGVSGAVKAFHKQLPRNMPQALAPPMRTDLFKSCFGHIKGCFA